MSLLVNEPLHVGEAGGVVRCAGHLVSVPGEVDVKCWDKERCWCRR